MRWFFRQRPETVKPERLYEYITLRRKRFCVHAMCLVVKVSESGYYRSLQSAGKPKPWQLLLVKIREIYKQNPDNDNYGVGRILFNIAKYLMDHADISTTANICTHPTDTSLKTARKLMNSAP